MASDGKDKTQKRLTFDGEYHSPVFTPDDRQVLALRGEALVWVSPESGASRTLDYKLEGVVKLIAFQSHFEKQADSERPRVVAITKTSIGLFSPWDGKFEPFPVAESDEETRQELLRGQMQVGDLLVQVGATGHELTLQKDGGEQVVLASSAKVIYAEPALSHDGRRVVFVRAALGTTN